MEPKQWYRNGWLSLTHTSKAVMDEYQALAGGSRCSGRKICHHIAIVLGVMLRACRGENPLLIIRRFRV